MDKNLTRDHSPERLARIDRNLMVLRDKIDEAERITGKTRSQLLEKLSPDEKSEERALNLLAMEKPKTESVDVNDLLALQKILDRLNFALLGKTIKTSKKSLLGI